MQVTSSIREPLVIGGKTVADVSHDISRHVENPPNRLWWSAFGISLVLLTVGAYSVWMLLWEGIECVQAMLGHPGLSAVQILGEIDALKFRSCLTLFAEVAPGEPCFRAALERFYGGERDSATLRLLADAGR